MPDQLTEAPAETTTIVLADDHAVVRAGLRLLLQAEPGWEVVAEAGDTETAVRKVAGHRPDVLVLDLNMPGGSTLEALPAIAARSPETRVVVLTMQDDPEYARRAIAAGAKAYVLKESADVELVEAIHRAARGDTYLSPQLGAALATATSGPPGGLTARELDVLRLLALGHINPEIAEQLFLSVRTVETHRARMQQKLRLTTRAELVRYALEHHLVEP